MRGLLAIYRRELAGLFLSPLAWILFCLTLLFNGLIFLYALEREMGGEVNASLSVVLGGGRLFWIILAFLAPLLTMRMISEESQSGMLELLLTAPLSDAALVCGKALAAITLFALLWSSVAFYGVATSILGAAPDWGVVFTSWLGATLASAPVLRHRLGLQRALRHALASGIPRDPDQPRAVLPAGLDKRRCHAGHGSLWWRAWTCWRTTKGPFRAAHWTARTWSSSWRGRLRSCSSPRG